MIFFLSVWFNADWNDSDTDTSAGMNKFVVQTCESCWLAKKLFCNV
jgi:hypothetical protein